jgi:hypothetical protein
MKTKLFLTITFLSLLLFNVQAQPPQKFRYQAIARDDAGNPLANTSLKVRSGIHDLTQTGVLVYQETQTITTNTFGLFNLSIGGGSVTSGVFTAINWGTGSKYIEVEIDFGAGYVSLGSSELLSIPYALYAPGVTGTPGTNGTNGAVWRDGAGVPANGLGINGDYYLNDANGDVYLKTAGAYSIATNIKGAVGTNGTNGTNGINGTNGTNGSNGTNAIVDFAEFIAIMAPDNAATVATGAAVQFPQLGPTSVGSTITMLTTSTFNIAAIGTYMVNWQVSVNEPGQLLLKLNAVEVASTVVGRATGTSQLVGSTLITTAAVNTVLSVVNPTGNPGALTITPTAGGTKPVSATLMIMRIQ